MLQNSVDMAEERLQLLQLLSTELIKVEDRLQTDPHSEERILRESLSKEKAIKKIKRGRRNALLVTPRCNRRFNFDMCNEIYYEIASYLELRDLIAFTATCSKAADALQGYILNIDRFCPVTYSWFQRCKIVPSSPLDHTLLGNVHERDAPVSSVITCLEGRFLVVGGYDGNISIWESNADSTCNLLPTCRKMVKAHNGWILSLTKVSSSVFASSGSDGSIKIWCVESILDINYEEGTCGNTIETTVIKERTKSGRKINIPCLGIRAKSANYMFTETPPNYRLYNGVSVEEKDPLVSIQAFPEHVEKISCVNSTLFVAGSKGSLIKYRIVPTITIDHKAKELEHDPEPYKLSFFLSRCRKIFKSILHEISCKTMEGENCEMRHVTALNDGKLVGISRNGRDIVVFEGDTWVTAYSTDRPTMICALPSGGFIVCLQRGSMYVFRDIGSTPFLPDVGGPHWISSNVQTSAVFALDDRYIVIGAVDCSLSLYDLQTRKVRTIRRAHSSFVTSIAYLSDSKCIISGSLDGSIRFTRLDSFGPVEF